MTHRIYNIQMKSPMGMKRGRARIRRQDNRIVLELLGEENQFNGEFVQEYSFNMDGTLKTAMRNLNARLCGSVSDGHLQATLQTERGTFPIEGTLEEGCTEAL